MSSPRTGTAAFGFRGEAPTAVDSSTEIGRWLIVGAYSLAAAAGATAFGFWMGAGDRLLKLETALALAAGGLAAVPLAVLLVASEGVSRTRAGQRPSYPMLLRFAAAMLSAAAALVHFAVIKQHADEYMLYGAFFVAVGFGQLAWALLVVSVPSRALYVLGALGNTAVVAFFIVTRTVGTLIGPEASQPATVGFGDIATTVFEALIATLSVALLFTARLRLRSSPVALAGGASLLTLMLAPQTALALQSAVTSAPFVPHAG